MSVLIPSSNKKQRSFFLEFSVGNTTLEDMEYAFIFKVLHFFEGKRLESAIALGISTRTLSRKLRAMGKVDYMLEEKHKKLLRGLTYGSKHK